MKIISQVNSAKLTWSTPKRYSSYSLQEYENSFGHGGDFDKLMKFSININIENVL